MVMMIVVDGWSGLSSEPGGIEALCMGEAGLNPWDVGPKRYGPFARLGFHGV